MSSETYYECYCDGGCSPNPGVGGWGWYYKSRNFQGLDFECSGSGGHPKTTNNRMELTAFLELLKAIPKGATAHIHSDSQYVLKMLCEGIARGTKATISKQNNSKIVTADKRSRFLGYNPTGWLRNKMEGGYPNTLKDIPNKDLWLDTLKEINLHVMNNTVIHLSWVKGHSGVYGNEYVDKLCKVEMQKLKN